MAEVSGELIDKVAAMLDGSQPEMVARQVLEAVLPDIERPWQEKVQEIAEMNVRQQKLLVERDKEIASLNADLGEAGDDVQSREWQLEEALGRLAERDKEIEELLGVIETLEVENGHLSTRAKLEG